VEGRDEEDEVQGVNEENGQGSVIPLAPVNKGWIFPPNVFMRSHSLAFGLPIRVWLPVLFVIAAGCIWRGERRRPGTR